MILHDISLNYCQQGTFKKNCALLGYYTASSGNSLPMFWDNLSCKAHLIFYYKLKEMTNLVQKLIKKKEEQGNTN